MIMISRVKTVSQLSKRPMKKKWVMICNICAVKLKQME